MNSSSTCPYGGNICSPFTRRWITARRWAIPPRRRPTSTISPAARRASAAIGDTPLGPRDNIGSGNPVGGNLRIVGNVELIFPVPEKWKSAARVSWFYDAGNVFQTGSKVQFKGADSYSPVDYHFERWSDLKRSTGIAVQWLAPLGLF